MKEFIWTDDLVKQYAEAYRFSSSRINIEQFKEGLGWERSALIENYNAAISTELKFKAARRLLEFYFPRIPPESVIGKLHMEKFLLDVESVYELFAEHLTMPNNEQNVA
jgi:hypothetical protein